MWLIPELMNVGGEYNRYEAPPDLFHSFLHM